MRASLALAGALATAALCAAAPGQQFGASQPGALADPLAFALGVLGDHDADGDLDLFGVHLFTGQPRLFANDGSGCWTDVSAALAAPVAVQAVQSVTFVDHDGDGDLDVFASAMVGSYLLENLGAGAWAPANALPPSPPPGAFVAADFDGDGDQDLAGVGFSINRGRNQLLENRGNGTFAARDPFPGEGIGIAAGDIDGDGDLDLYAGTPPRLWRNDGGLSFTEVTAVGLPPLAPTLGHAAFGDLDGDGDPDLVLVDLGGGADVVLQNLGTGAFAAVPAALGPLLAVSRAPTLGDVDGDGDLDLLRPRANLPPLLARNDGTGRFSDDPAAIPAIAAASAALAVGDLDGDGDDDAVLLTTAATNWVLGNRHRQLEVPTTPRLGQPWAVDLWSLPGYGPGPRLGYLAIGLVRRPQPLPLPPFGGLWLDLGTPTLIGAAPIPVAAAPASFAVAIPNQTSIRGVELHLQGLVEEAVGFANARLTAVVSTRIQ